MTEISQVIDLLAKIFWAALPILIGWAILQFNKRSGNMDLLAFIVEKADSLVEWAEKEFPDINELEKIDMIVDAIIVEMKKYGYDFEKLPIDVKSIKQEVIAAYGMRNSSGVELPTLEVTDNMDI